MYLTTHVCAVQDPSALQEPPYPKVCRPSPLVWGGRALLFQWPKAAKVSCEPLDLRPSGPPPHLGPRQGLNRIAGGPGSRGACLVCPESGDKNVDDHSSEDQGRGSIVELI